MNMQKLHRIFALILTLVLVMTMAAPIGAKAATGWTPKTDTEIFWVKTADSDISNEALEAQVKLFASELDEKNGCSLNITYGDASQAGANDIILVLDSTSGVAAQGYRITVDTAVTITTSDADGLFYGCRYLIKELLLNGSVAAVSDAPWVGERAVSLDNGRKYFTVDWIKELIREMSWANMNTLVLHFSEEMGLGIESELYPWLAGRDGTLCTQADLGSDYDSRCLTQAEVEEIIQYAKLYHIDVVPSLDSPGHMNYIVKKFNEQCATQPFSFTYDGVTYTAEAGSKIGNYYKYGNATTDVVPGSRNTAYSRGIDISNEVAVAFTKSLIEEYATLFASQGCTKFDIGGDELLGWGSAAVSGVNKWQQLDHWKSYAQSRTGNSNAVAYDAFLLYMNDLNALVRGLGYTSVRMWNDDALRSSDTGWTGVVQLDTNIDIWFWSKGTNKYATYADAGYEIYNILGDYNYYAMTAEYFSDSRSSFAYAYADQIYNYWNPFEYNIVTGSNRDYAEWNDSRVLGGAFGIWCDNPSLRTEAQMMEELRPLIRANAAKCWYPGANGLVDYNTYTANWEIYSNAPTGTKAAPEIFVIADLTALEAAVAEYETVDAALYTEESFAAYTGAVEVGKALLAAERVSQEQADEALEAIEDAKAALAEKPVVDITALNAAISDYEKADADLYTEDSFADYTAAVTAGKNLLEKGGYTQEAVDAAVKAIQDAKAALAEKSAADITALNAAISDYDKVNGAQYTPDSFAAYTSAVTAAKNLLNTGTYSQTDVDAALAAINAAKAALVPSGEGVECILSASSKTQKAYVGKSASFSISTKKDVTVVGILIIDDFGKQVTITKCTQNTTKADRNCSTVSFKLTKNDRGNRTYTIYAILEDGSLSADSIQLTLKVI